MVTPSQAESVMVTHGSPGNAMATGQGASRDHAPAAILLTDFAEALGRYEFDIDIDQDPPPQHVQGTVVFQTPVFEGIPSISIFHECYSGTCDCVHHIGDFPCQLKPCRAAPYLFGSSRLDTVSDSDRLYLWKGLTKGFEIVDADCPSVYHCENYDSITSHGAYEEMSALLRSELECHKVVDVDNKPRCVHSLGAVWKSNGKLRPITDCSRPDNTCINNYMQSTFAPFSYNSVEDAVQILDPTDYLAVVDISSAYRSVNVLAEHSQFQGLSWDFGDGPVWLRDLRLCFGLRCAPNIFNAISNFIVQIANNLGASRVVNYLDDFLVIASDEDTCKRHRDIVTSVIEHLGFLVAWKKVTSPSTVSTFLGITIDTVNMELSLPLAKVEKLKDFITSLLNKGVATKKDLQSIGGLVSHCSYVVRGGRTFSRRIFDLAASYSRHSTSIPLNPSIRADLEWWLAFCDTFNGRACIIRDLHPIPLYSDASFTGFGAWMGLDWIYGTWEGESASDPLVSQCVHLQTPPTFDTPGKNINVYELWPVVLGVKRWARFFTNSRIHVITDNMQVLAMLNTGRSANRTCMTWLRELFWLCFVFNLDIYATYIRSADNLLADALSRLAYHGMASKCVTFLDDSNMCCSHLLRPTDDCNSQTSGTTQGSCMGSIDQEGSSVAN